ncbi:proteophosphoglycan ppg4 [Rhodotorula toruloides]|uniref:Proteophosphoglycan ppg4 n=1 Tax=Rhodotorula toruloides TaxID=5286 RepID=A0A511KJF2_RHOTO|nr:proteophosphoglycan ppg4 [Rhodotorula toruloides]
MARFTPLRALVGTSLFASLALAQTAAQISQEQLTLATVIPTNCNAQCQTWLATLGTCPAAASATYAACVCDATFVSNFQTCAACLQTSLTATNDAVNAATATNAPTDLTNYCATAGNAVSLSSTLTSTTTTAAVAATGTTTQRTYSVSIPPITSVSLTFSTVTSSSALSLSSGETESSMSEPRVVTLQLTNANVPFPTQSKGTSAFANSAPQKAGFAVGKVVGALAVVAGGMMLV